MDAESEVLHKSEHLLNGEKVGGWTTVVSWFKSWLPERSKLCEPNPKQRIAELVISELTWQMKLMEQNRLEREKEKKKLISGVDYSWLVTSKPKFPVLSEFKRLELEDLCYRLDPDDCTEVIRSMWRTCLNEPLATDLPDLLHSILLTRIQEKKFQQIPSNYSSSLGEWSKWLGGSVLNLFSNQSEKSSGNSQQELSRFNSLEMVEMGIEPVDL